METGLSEALDKGGGAKINEVDARGYTPLMYACDQAEPDHNVVRLLMEAKANADIAEPLSGMAPLHYVCHYGHRHILDVLLKGSANPNVRRRTDGFTPLMIAAKHSHPEVALLLVRARADPTAKSTGDRFTDSTALHMACDVGCYQIVELLCSHPKTQLNARRAKDRGTRPYAAAFVLSIIAKFVSQPPSIVFHLYRAALYAAVVKGHRSATVRLVEAKANVNIPNHKRVTPLMTAKALGHDDIIRVLDQADAKSWVEFSEK
mgnify:FL=1